MKKILTLWDGKHWSEGALDLSCYLSKLTHSRLTGIFPSYHEVMELPAMAAVNGNGVYAKPVAALPASGQQAIQDAIAHFQHVCQQRGVGYTAHRHMGDSESDLLTETLFADILIADETTAFPDGDARVPSRFIRSLLTGAKCPVIIAPQSFEALDEIIFAYDGSPSSIFAIKQFTYLFPELKDRKITIAEVTERGIVDEYYPLEEWLENYYSDIQFEVLDGDAQDRLFEFALSRQRAILVMGAFGRNALSTFFKPSAAEDLIRVATIPVFIAHH